MRLEATPVVVCVEGPGSTVGGLETPGNWIKKLEQELHTGEKGGRRRTHR